jgi:hypothetical protein
MYWSRSLSLVLERVAKAIAKYLSVLEVTLESDERKKGATDRKEAK